MVEAGFKNTCRIEGMHRHEVFFAINLFSTIATTLNLLDSWAALIVKIDKIIFVFFQVSNLYVSFFKSKVKI